MDHRVDLYQAGILLLSTLLGRIPRFTFEETVSGLPCKIAEELQSGYGKVVARALRLKVADRFSSAREFWQVLDGSEASVASEAGPAA
jgi:hypothetical protein